MIIAIITAVLMFAIYFNDYYLQPYRVDTSGKYAVYDNARLAVKFNFDSTKVPVLSQILAQAEWTNRPAAIGEEKPLQFLNWYKVDSLLTIEWQWYFSEANYKQGNLVGGVITIFSPELDWVARLNFIHQPVPAVRFLDTRLKKINNDHFILEVKSQGFWDELKNNIWIHIFHMLVMVFLFVLCGYVVREVYIKCKFLFYRMLWARGRYDFTYKDNEPIEEKWKKWMSRDKYIGHTYIYGVKIRPGKVRTYFF